ncbi:hypothetical protein H1C71_018356 [Ictidomys tridecemlineatus]|nr:hypothetical protein H1C71_018356 [Ictidomys tridecemlineatus]
MRQGKENQPQRTCKQKSKDHDSPMKPFRRTQATAAGPRPFAGSLSSEGPGPCLGWMLVVSRGSRWLLTWHPFSSFLSTTTGTVPIKKAHPSAFLAARRACVILCWLRCEDKM